MKTFAVIDKARDCLAGLPTARKKSELVERFPESQFDLVDMTGQEPRPNAPGLMTEDLTVNKTTKKWKVKGKTIPERKADAKDGKVKGLLHRIVDLEVRKDRVASMGDAYAGVKADLQAAIDSAKEEITELER